MEGEGRTTQVPRPGLWDLFISGEEQDRWDFAHFADKPQKRLAGPGIRGLALLVPWGALSARPSARLQVGGVLLPCLLFQPRLPSLSHFPPRQE